MILDKFVILSGRPTMMSGMSTMVSGRSTIVSERSTMVLGRSIKGGSGGSRAPLISPPNGHFIGSPESIKNIWGPR